MMSGKEQNTKKFEFVRPDSAKLRKESEISLEKQYENTHKELTLQQSKRDQIITIEEKAD